LLFKYFRTGRGDWQLRDDIRAMIDFQPLKLAQPWPPMSAMDLVLLRMS